MYVRPERRFDDSSFAHRQGENMSKKDKEKKGKQKPGKDSAAESKKPEKVKASVETKSKSEAATNPVAKSIKIDKKAFEKELGRLQVELVKLQEWVRFKGLKVVVIFEGRDAAGKGGVIKRITESLNPRVCRVVALPAPTEREKTQWYFQRYAAHLPAAGEMVLFDRSWYNRAGVERVMGFCTEAEYAEFLRSVPEFERMLGRSGIILIKYWFSVSDKEQERRFQARIADPTKRWKLSPMDLQSRARWEEYSKAKDEMFASTDIKQAPWYVVNADNKFCARLNCIRHLLSLIPFEDLTPEPIVLPPRQKEQGYVRPPITDQTFVPQVYVPVDPDVDSKD
jgi:polyphosphate kinase 2